MRSQATKCSAVLLNVPWSCNYGLAASKNKGGDEGEKTSKTARSRKQQEKGSISTCDTGNAEQFSKAAKNKTAWDKI